VSGFEVELSDKDFEILDGLVADSTAKPQFCDNANSLIWMDEIPKSTEQCVSMTDNLEFIELLVYRSYLILGRKPLRHGIWNIAQEKSPNWPGFLANRRDGNLSKLLLQFQGHSQSFATWHFLNQSD